MDRENSVPSGPKIPRSVKCCLISDPIPNTQAGNNMARMTVSVAPVQRPALQFNLLLVTKEEAVTVASKFGMSITTFVALLTSRKDKPLVVSDMAVPRQEEFQQLCSS